MRKLVCALLAVTIFISMMVDTRVSATSWIVMEPQEVSDRAEVVVSGTYDFSSKAVSSDFIFVGFTFNVENVYRGEASSKITVGIDQFDVGWADEFQNEGGKFLLFLENSDEATFLTPVAGPNGMIQFFDGKVQNLNTESQIFYEDILESTSKKPGSESDIVLVNNQKSGSAMLVWIGGAATIAILGLTLLYRYRKKKR